MITNFFNPELNNHDVQELWFQQDGAKCHTARATLDLLKDTFGDRLISRFGPVNWPPRSCDLTPRLFSDLPGNCKQKNTGNYIKIQTASEEDHENIKKLLITKKADHYIIEEPKIIKTVIKGLPASTDVADIESELKEKGIAVEKVAQLRRFVTKAPLPYSW
ncbi:uncharacterized protein TNCV_856921 [Trichonephila clavipes]|nr:uncharacterized protein TNCV_856921 [Trichonephila clavipes]